MELDKAKTIIKELAEAQERWGKHAGFMHYSQDDGLGALLAIHKAGLLDFNADASQLREDLTLARRQLGASEARASKLVKHNEELRAEIAELKEHIAALHEELDDDAE